MIMKISLVVSTYNWPEALRLCLNSVCRQTRIPDEVIIADDGSRSDTKKLVEQFKDILPIKYVWQPDNGFRKTLIMNKAFSVCTGDYIIQIDGDIILDRHFCADHISSAQEGYFIQGSRGKFDKATTEKILKIGKYTPNFFSLGLHRRLNTLRIPFLSKFFYDYSHIRGCNMSFWRKDIKAINGYDNNMIGYGREDTDLTARLLRSGVKKRFLKFKAIEYHLWHDEVPSKHIDTITNKRYVYNNEHCIVRVNDGMEQVAI